ncbi:hypothetical protein [cf. Phormidesmis sp. LEGE 11477]|uniref:hypothetical protein n=1 Tax=cf. Phormidesmis sp. LEGE 11477 TaxID=1828680 RepID=UPI001882895F|nr:hypothetical protein [cf. Phormidesmis sp. LEGE 11477]MBE9064839.1 hypothetical protein [cf. Phormidesmis sp. LEGE 11477]
MSLYEDSKDLHARAQAEIWIKFLKELESLKKSCNASWEEIGKALGVSKTALNNFKKVESSDEQSEGKQKTLPISRSDILNLWAYLSDTERQDLKRTADIAQRKQLRKDGPNRLLLSAGFIPEKISKPTETYSDDPQIRRVMHRLESQWIFDATVRVYITNQILDKVLDLGQPNPKAHVEKLPLLEVLDWPKGNPLQSHESEVIEKYRRAVGKLVLSGKIEFVQSELFELYQSILEHNLLGSGGRSKLRIVDCQFKALSESLSNLAHQAAKKAQADNEKPDETTRGIEYLAEELEDISKKAEEELLALLWPNNLEDPLSEILDKEDTALNMVSNPCLEAKIRYRWELKEATHQETGEKYKLEKTIQQAVSIRYSSTATHVENMLIAMKLGLGYPLGISGFSIRATGRTEKSLARISIALSEDDPTSIAASSDLRNAQPLKTEDVYEGWWVTSNTIIGILSATSDAVERWIRRKKANLETYHSVCAKSAQFGEQFYTLRKFLYEYTPQLFNSGAAEEDLEEGIKETIDDISNYFQEKRRISRQPIYRKNFRIIENRQDMLRLMLVHTQLSKGKVVEAGELYHSMRENIEGSEENPYSYVLSTYAEACDMSHKLISGDKTFLAGRRLVKDSNNTRVNVEPLENYIRKVGSIDFDVYLVLSQLFAITGILDFYSNPKPGDTDNSLYTHSTSLLLQAAHYSLRIGHRRRASQWLGFAGRMCLRLGDRPRARQLYNVALHVSDDYGQIFANKLFDLSYVDTEKTWASVNIFLLAGEIHLKDKNLSKALCSCIIALDITIRSGYVRMMPDCLYDIARVANMARNNSSKPDLKEDINPFSGWNSTRADLFRRRIHSQDTANKVFAFIDEFLTQNAYKESVPSELAKVASDLAAQLWNQWADSSGNGKHPFSSEIEEYKFLQFFDS